MKISKSFDTYPIPQGGIAGSCHVLRENERNALLEYFVKALPDCYIAQAALGERIKATGKTASEILANKVPDPAQIKSGDFGEITTLYFLSSECAEKVTPAKKWRYKQDRNKAAPHSDVVIFHREFDDKASANDYVINAESKQKSAKGAFNPIADAITGIAKDQTGRLARTLAWLREKAIDHGTPQEIKWIERFTHGLSVTYKKHYKAVAVIDLALLDGELTRKPAPAQDGSFEVVVIGIKDLKAFYETVFERAVKEVAV